MSRSSYQKAEFKKKFPRIVEGNNEFGTAAKACKTIRQSLQSIPDITLPKKLTPMLNKLCLEMVSNGAGSRGERRWDALRQKQHLINFRWKEEMPFSCSGTCAVASDEKQMTITCQMAFNIKVNLGQFEHATHFSFLMAAIPTCVIHYDEAMKQHNYEQDLYYKAIYTAVDDYYPVNQEEYRSEHQIQIPLTYPTQDWKTVLVLAIAIPARQTEKGINPLKEALIKVVDVVGRSA